MTRQEKIELLEKIRQRKVSVEDLLTKEHCICYELQLNGKFFEDRMNQEYTVPEIMIRAKAATVNMYTYSTFDGLAPAGFDPVKFKIEVEKAAPNSLPIIIQKAY